MTHANEDQIEYWNGAGGLAWASGADQYDGTLAPHLDLVVETAQPIAGESALDIGCGSGALTRAVAAATGRAVGVDVSAPLLDLARTRSSTAVTFTEADAQTATFDSAPFDLVVSRFGVMFFANPLAAFTNIRRATAPGGRLVFVAWQPVHKNEWITMPVSVLRDQLEALVELPQGPGPFAFGDDEYVRDLLHATHWTDVEVIDQRVSIPIGGPDVDAAGAAAWFTGDGIGRRVLEDATDDERAVARAALTDVLRERVPTGPVWLDSAVWLVSATNPVT